MPAAANILTNDIVASWPAGADATALSLYVAIAFGLPTLGYIFFALDVRRYLQSLRRALIVVTRLPIRTHYWALKHQPPCLAALGLDAHSTEQQVMAAYRKRVKQFHPDRGGEMRDFLLLQQHFEQALYLIRQRAERGE